jgi:hypothetical protein
VVPKKEQLSKLTKHGFLDKIKAAAKTKGSVEQNEEKTSDLGKNPTNNERTNRSSWNALQDDYMLNSKKVGELNGNLRKLKRIIVVSSLCRNENLLTTFCNALCFQRIGTKNRQRRKLTRSLS